MATTFIHAKRNADGKQIKAVVDSTACRMQEESAKQGFTILEVRELPEKAIHKSKVKWLMAGFSLIRQSPALLKIDLTGKGMASKFAQTACTMSHLWDTHKIGYVTTAGYAYIFSTL